MSVEAKGYAPRFTSLGLRADFDSRLGGSLSGVSAGFKPSLEQMAKAVSGIGLPLERLIPPRMERLRIVREKGAQVERTGDHEVRHLLTGLVLGAEVNLISVNPMGNSLGRVEASAGFRAFQIIAAAGASGGDRSGCGADFAAIAAIDAYLGNRPGSSIESAINAASGLISAHFPDEVIERIKEMVIYRGEVEGEAFIKQIVQRAFLEYALEKDAWGIIEKYNRLMAIPRYREQTIGKVVIGTGKDGKQYEEYYEGKGCPICGAVSGHIQAMHDELNKRNQFREDGQSVTIFSGDLKPEMAL
jgi:hypothetical protein